MNILVIGNGFDLAHGLPTTYADFMGFIEYFNIFYDSDAININRTKYAEDFKKLNEKVQQYLLSEKVTDRKGVLVKELYSISSKNIWIKHFKKCIDNNMLKGDNWIDFECEILEVVKSLECLQNGVKESLKTHKKIKDVVNDIQLLNRGKEFVEFMNENKVGIVQSDFNYSDFCNDIAKKAIDSLNNELNELIRCLEIYLEDVVGTINIEKQLCDITEIKSIDKLISFNYTDTFNKKYSRYQGVEADYIHGRVNISRGIENNNMVLGIDEYLQGNKKREELDFIQFKKYFQRIYKKTGCKYKHWLANAKKIQTQMYPNGMDRNSPSGYVNNIYIYGHSLDVTDKDILRELILFPNTQVNIFYYNKDDYAQKIRNMVALIDQDELIDRVYGEKPQIVFREIQK